MALGHMKILIITDWQGNMNQSNNEILTMVIMILNAGYKYWHGLKEIKASS